MNSTVQRHHKFSESFHISFNFQDNPKEEIFPLPSPSFLFNSFQMRKFGLEKVTNLSQIT